MNPTTNKALPCAVFGHNYVKSKTNMDNTSELTCCNCNTIVVTDIDGNFEESSISNSNIQSTLRKLFLLKQRSITANY